MDTKKKQTMPSYGLLTINHAYNQGKITFKEWLELTRQWAEKTCQEYAEEQKPDERQRHK